MAPGTTPGPLLLGSIMDSACKVWQDICGTEGNCWIYEKTDMGIKLFIWWIIIKILSLVCNFVAQYFYIPPHDVDDDDDGDNDDFDEDNKPSTACCDEEKKTQTDTGHHEEKSKVSVV